MRSASFKSFVASILAVASTVAWSAPAFALRPNEAAESGLEERLAAALRDGNPDRALQGIARQVDRVLQSLVPQAPPRPAAALPAGLEEAPPRPVIGYFSPLSGPDAQLSERLFSDQSGTRAWARGQITTALRAAVKTVVEEKARRAVGEAPKPAMYAEFDKAFGRVLRLSRGDMEEFAQAFLRLRKHFPRTEESQYEAALLDAVRRIAQDPGAPHNVPPISYFNPARYVYARLQQNVLDSFVRDVLSEVAESARRVSESVDLSDVGWKKNALIQKLKEGRLTKGPYQYEIFWDSLVRKQGETYLTLELLLNGEQGYEKGVVLDLQVVIPAVGGRPRYRGPYSLAVSTQTLPHFSVELLDPIHFINTRFPEWRPKAQRDIYESRLQALKDSGEKDKRQFIRPSERQGNNPRFFEPFFRAYLAGDVPLAYHIVDALGSERDYGNQGGVGSVGNLASAIVRRGGIGATASWLLEEPDAARTVAGEGRTLVYSYEKDHHRIDSIRDMAGFASELEPFLLAYWENLMTGWPSANLQDETKFINQKAREEALKAGAAIAQTGTIDETVFGLLQETYNGKPVAEGLPSSLGMHWLRNRWLHDVVDTLRAEGVSVTPFNRWYIEPDYALDAKPHTVEEMAYLTLMSWVSAQAHGHPLGPVVPSYGNVHGASAGNPSLALAGILQYAAQAVTLYGEPLPADLLAIARKAPKGSLALAEKAAGYFNDLSLKEKFPAVVGTAGERTADEEARLSAFILAQLQKIPADVLKTLKEAEQVLLKEVVAAQAEKEKGQAKQLEEVAPQVASNLSALTARLDREINALPLERRAGITTHAASGLSAQQLSKAREYGVIFANKSTEFQNIITKQLEVVYLMAADPAKAQEEFKRMPAAQAAWNANPLDSTEIQRVAKLYAEMYDAAAKRAKKEVTDPLRPFPWFYNDEVGWSMKELAHDESGKLVKDQDGKPVDVRSWAEADWKWLPGDHGRYMFSMRDKMTGQGTEDTLLFPNALTWGLPPTVIRMAQAEIERTIHFYHQPAVMNAVGGAAEFRAHAGLEERPTQPDWSAYWNRGYPSTLDGDSTGRMREYWRGFLEEVRQGNPAARILEIGIGDPEKPSVLSVAGEVSGGFGLYAVDNAGIIPQGTTMVGRIHLRHNPAERTGFDDASFDAVTGSYALEWTPMELTFRELSRVMAPGARAAFLMAHEGSRDVIKTREALDSGVFSMAGKVFEETRRFLWDPSDTNGKALDETRRKMTALLERDENPYLQEALRVIALALEAREADLLEDAHRYLAGAERRFSFYAQMAPRLVETPIASKDRPKIVSFVESNGFELETLEPFFADGEMLGWELKFRKPKSSEAPRAADMEEVGGAIRALDAPHIGARLRAIRSLRSLELVGTPIPEVGPKLPSYLHVHTNVSYPGVPGVVSPTHMVWAAHEAGAGSILLVEHESQRHVAEAWEAADLVNEDSEKPLQVAFGIEFRAPVDPDSSLGQALRQAGRGNAGWVVGMGMQPNAFRNDLLGRLAKQFQEAKQNRAKRQLARLRQQLGLDLALAAVSTPEGNITERSIAFAAAKAQLGPETSEGTLAGRASEIRSEFLESEPYLASDGFVPYENMMVNLAGMGLIPTFTAQVPVDVLEGLIPELTRMGIRALDVAGIEPGEPDAEAKINRIIGLAEQNRLLVFGGSDYRGAGTGWLQPAAWMQDPSIAVSLQRFPSQPQRAGLEEARFLREGELYQAGDQLVHPVTGGLIYEVLENQPDAEANVVLTAPEAAGSRMELDLAQLRPNYKVVRNPGRPPLDSPPILAQDNGASAVGLGETVGAALWALNELGAFVTVPEVKPGLKARPILIDASGDLRVAHLAQALSVTLSHEVVPELDFRLVIQQDRVESLIRQLAQVNEKAAEKFLRPRIVPYDGEEMDAGEAKLEALAALRRRFDFDSVSRMAADSGLLVVDEMTPSLLAELAGFFVPGGLRFVSSEAEQRLRAFLEAA